MFQANVFALAAGFKELWENSRVRENSRVSVLDYCVFYGGEFWKSGSKSLRAAWGSLTGAGR